MFKEKQYVLVTNSFSSVTIDKIKKITPTGIIRLEKHNSISFNQDGLERGNGGYYRRNIKPLSESKRRELIKKQIVKKINGKIQEIEQKNYSLEKLNEFLNLTENFIKEGNDE